MDKTDIKIGITAGSFDCTHAGHYLMFEECRNQCDYLIVCLQTDPSIDREQKNKPVQSVFERFLQLKSCKFVDEIIVYETEDDFSNILSSMKYHIRFIGADWKDKKYTGCDIPGMSEKVVFNTRNHGYSTTSLRQRIHDAELEKQNNT